VKIAPAMDGDVDVRGDLGDALFDQLRIEGGERGV
jgi:hypothetical protein